MPPFTSFLLFFPFLAFIHASFLFSLYSLKIQSSYPYIIHCFTIHSRMDFPFLSAVLHFPISFLFFVYISSIIHLTSIEYRFSSVSPIFFAIPLAYIGFDILPFEYCSSPEAGKTSACVGRASESIWKPQRTSDEVGKVGQSVGRSRLREKEEKNQYILPSECNQFIRTHRWPQRPCLT